MRALPIIAIAALAFDATAIAQPATPPASPQQPIEVIGQKQRPEDKVICKQVSTGTLVANRVCLKRSEWAKASADSSDALRSMRDLQRVRCGGVAC